MFGLIEVDIQNWEEETIDSVLYLLRKLRNDRELAIIYSVYDQFNDTIKYLVTAEEEADNLLMTLSDTGLIFYNSAYGDKIEVAQESGNDHQKARQSFCILHDNIVLAPAHWKNCSSYDWMKYDLLLSPDDLESTVRGSLSKDHLRLYQGATFESIHMGSFPEDRLRMLCKLCCDMYKVQSICVDNGAIPGEDGTEWEARESLGTFTAESK